MVCSGEALTNLLVLTIDFSTIKHFSSQQCQDADLCKDPDWEDHHFGGGAK